jgi:RimJ/RimL family protein N-acetyltransferase
MSEPAATSDRCPAWLRPIVPADLDIHFEQQRYPESVRMSAVAPRDRAAFDAHMTTVLADPTVVFRTIVVDGHVAGSAVSFVRDGMRQVGYWIGREHWGRGIATAALAELLGELTERPLYATVAAHNAASLRVIGKCGFRPVGEQRQEDVLIQVLRLDSDLPDV